MNQPVFAQAGQLKWAWASGSLCWAGQSRPRDLASVDSKQSGCCLPRTEGHKKLLSQSSYRKCSAGGVYVPPGVMGQGDIPQRTSGGSSAGWRGSDGWSPEGQPAGLVLADFKQTLQSPWAEPLPAGMVIY